MHTATVTQFADDWSVGTVLDQSAFSKIRPSFSVEFSCFLSLTFL